MSSNNIACMNKCGRIRSTRGLCYNCHARFKRLIGKGQETWEALIAAGKALPPRNLRQEAREAYRKRQSKS